MANPLDDSYSAIAGATIYGGRTPGGGSSVDTPLWMLGAPLNSFIEIPNTNQTVTANNWAGPHGNLGVHKWIDGWGGWCVLPNGTIIVAAAGGHTDGDDNRVASLNPRADVPGWITETAPSTVYRDNQPYNLDGKPVARHNYTAIFWSETDQRVILVGCYATPGTGVASFPTMDGWDPVTKQWDPIGTYPYTVYPGQTYPGPDVNNVWPTPSGVNVTQGNMMDVDGNVWGTWDQNPPRYNSATKVWDRPGLTKLNGALIPVRFPWAKDTLRSQMFGMAYGDSQLSDLNLGIHAVIWKGTTLSKITFNQSDVVAKIASEFPTYAGLAYNTDEDYFLFYDGRNAGAGMLYKVTPNNTLVWDIEQFQYGSGGQPAPAVSNAGLNNRFIYDSQLKGFIIMPAGGASSPTVNLSFMRTA